MPAWDADIAVDASLVHGVLAEQFPELDAGSARPLAEGWDNAVWLVEERWAFRFPRREVAVACTERELVFLPRLDPLLPVPIPTPAFAGRPSERFPWPFFGAPLLPGREPADTGLAEGARIALAPAFGSFLRVLHATPTRDLVDPEGSLPRDPNRRADMPFRVERARECIAEVVSARLWSAPAAAEEILGSAAALPASDAESLLHGDLHLRHALVDEGALSAVIDWGDMCRGDPSIDLQVLWCLFPPDGRARFLESYGPVDDERLLRARATALYFCAMLAAYAHESGRERLLRECVAALERTLVDGT